MTDYQFVDTTPDEPTDPTPDEEWAGRMDAADRASRAEDRAWADRVPAPRPVPTTRERLTAAGCGHTPEQHRHTDGQDADARSEYRAIRELEAERDGLLRQQADLIRELTQSRDALKRAGIQSPTASTPELIDQLASERDERLTLAESSRLAKRVDAAEEAATFRHGVIDQYRDELGAAGEVIAVVRDAQEQIDRALARYDTAPEVTPVEPEHVHDDIECGCELTPADAPLGSVSPHAQDDLADRLATALADVLSQFRYRTGPEHYSTRVAVRQVDAWRSVYAEWADRAEAGTVDPEGAEQVLRDRLEHAIRARLDKAWEGVNAPDSGWLAQVAAVAAVTAVNELRQG